MADHEEEECHKAEKVITKGTVEDSVARIKILTQEVVELREEVRKLKTVMTIDLYCEVALDVEQAICSTVLPEIFIMNDLSANLHTLLKYLDNAKSFPLDPNKYDHNEILHKARDRWETVCNGFGFPKGWRIKIGEWDVYNCTIPGDIRAIEILKLSGTSMPCSRHISLKYAEENVESIEVKMAPWQYQLVATFIRSLREKMTRSRLHHDYLLVD